MKTPKAIPPKELARKLRGIGISPAFASQLTTGKRKPSGRMAARIEGALGIKASSWFQENP